jgi:hypothetical protein
MGLNQPVLAEKATAFGQVTQKVGSFVRENPGASDLSYGKTLALRLAVWVL